MKIREKRVLRTRIQIRIGFFFISRYGESQKSVILHILIQTVINLYLIIVNNVFYCFSKCDVLICDLVFLVIRQLFKQFVSFGTRMYRTFACTTLPYDSTHDAMFVANIDIYHHSTKLRRNIIIFPSLFSIFDFIHLKMFIIIFLQSIFHY